MRLALLFSAILSSFWAIAQQEVIGTPISRIQEPSIQAFKTGDTLDLPFRDDFSDEMQIPNPTRWTDFKVYVNNTFPVDQRSRGVATFDGLDEGGKAYDITKENSDTLCDVLTSQYLDLSGTTSPYLAFLYQEGGWGELPEDNDSLVVDFWNVDSARWERVWSVEGEMKESGWTWASISADDPKWLKNGFRFRIGNYGARNGAFDIWNVDYLSLEENRTPADTVVEDPAITQPHPVLSRNFKLIPWFHLSTGSFRLGWTMKYRRNGPPPPGGWPLNLGKYRVFQDGAEIASRTSVPVITNLNHNVELEYIVPFDPTNIVIPTAPMELRIQAWYDGVAVGVRKNDSISLVQHFDNAYAFDDGSAERVYGLTQGDSYMLTQFQPLLSDTLKGFQIYFGQAKDDITNEPFKLVVYSFDNNAPDNIIYESDSLYLPQYAGRNNQFVAYELDTPGIYINGTVYIGLKQLSSTPLTVGFDRNTDGDTTVIYGDGNIWYPSNQQGALMIRPYFRYHPNDISVIEPEPQNHFKLYPNPAEDYIQLDFDGGNSAEIQIVDLNGRAVLSTRVQARQPIDVSALPAGIYFVRWNNGQYIEVEKLLLH
ncbi:T9SS type A sorting domain-containing protein [Phaeocystidibacter luteus]|uniref:T9SS type A sorting domain-containing protein n=1 Tax=Phaeocystidibacter luteus TaxID=911197 RepID=A0A6N6RDH6_9FLAO|nr:T9SS type A sorting domain-containing protein [Phaeocystidibacter luteus]KAB2806813.1 T9SS type A sorting domain-containing protein [Phaeocystidibacter luteus]